MNPKTTGLICPFLLSVFLFCSGMVFCLELDGLTNETIPGHKTLEFSERNVRIFVERLKKERNELFAILQEKYQGDSKKIAKNTALWAYDNLIAAFVPLSEEVQAGQDTPELRTDFLQLQRIHYGILSDLGTRPKNLAFLSTAVFSVLKSVAHICAGPLLLRIPAEHDPEAPIGKERAKYEAANLYDSRGKGPMNPEVIAGLSPLEISRLEPPEKNAILDKGAACLRFPGKLKEIKKTIRALGKKHSKFDFNHSMRVVFFDEIKAEATSPKIMVKDRNGLKWKMKWGDEIHTAIVADRLYMNIGGKYSDPRFYSGPGETILVLASPKKQGKAVRTFSELRNEVFRAFFRFKLENWIIPDGLLRDSESNILGSGIIDAEIADREDIDRSHIGAYYVKFKECQMTLSDPACKRLGGSALSSLGASRDRIQRGMMLFNAWISNQDAKDDNTRVAFWYNPETEEFDRPVEFQSDNGATFGCIAGVGRPQYFHERMLVETPFGIHLLFHPIFVSKAWQVCTWSDARWMARKICSLSRQDITEAFIDSGWPGFIQQLMIEKLIARRNQLVYAFRLNLDGFGEIACNPNLTIRDSGEVLVENGKLNSRSTKIRKLISENHPEGFFGILIRFLNC